MPAIVQHVIAHEFDAQSIHCKSHGNRYSCWFTVQFDPDQIVYKLRGSVHKAGHKLGTNSRDQGWIRVNRHLSFHINNIHRV